MTITAECKQCGREYDAKQRSTSLYCSSKCKQRFYRNRIKPVTVTPVTLRPVTLSVTDKCIGTIRTSESNLEPIVSFGKPKRGKALLSKGVTVTKAESYSNASDSVPYGVEHTFTNKQDFSKTRFIPLQEPKRGKAKGVTITKADSHVGASDISAVKALHQAIPKPERTECGNIRVSKPGDEDYNGICM